MPAPALDPERPYTPYQKRQAIGYLSEKKGLDIFDASDLFSTMEYDNPDGIVKLCKKFDAKPKTGNPKFDDVEDDDGEV